MKQGTIISLKLTVFIIGVIIFVLCAYGLPMLSRVSSEMNPEFAYLKLPVLLGLYVTALIFSCLVSSIKAYKVYRK